MDRPLEQLFDIPKTLSVSPLTGGGNNRVYKVGFENRKPLIYKQYFQHPNDPRPRLDTEFSFLHYAWNLGIRNIPEPLQINVAANAALYSFCPGRILEEGEINDSLIQETIAFFLALNRTKSSGFQLRNASEAAFSLHDYLRIVEERIGRLRSIASETPIEKAAASFFQEELLPLWKRIQERLCKTALHIGMPLDAPLAQQDQCVSPSDFGFHNALISPEGRLAFIDFEYAGWDDPCKTVCDLFCQPKIPVPEKYFPLVSETFASVTADPESCLKRIAMIRPVMQIKWCCILLNTFTQVGKSRRVFSQSEEINKQEKQLHSAKQLLNQVKKIWPT